VEYIEDLEESEEDIEDIGAGFGRFNESDEEGSSKGGFDDESSSESSGSEEGVPEGSVAGPSMRPPKRKSRDQRGLKSKRGRREIEVEEERELLRSRR
jgi:hypothetical protein